MDEKPDDQALNLKLSRAKRSMTNSKYYEEARRLARLVSSECQCSDKMTRVVTTGGGAGIMEAANRGAHDAGAKSMGMNIVLPFARTLSELISSISN